MTLVSFFATRAAFATCFLATTTFSSSSLLLSEDELSLEDAALTALTTSAFFMTLVSFFATRAAFATCFLATTTFFFGVSSSLLLSEDELPLVSLWEALFFFTGVLRVVFVRERTSRTTAILSSSSSLDESQVDFIFFVFRDGVIGPCLYDWYTCIKFSEFWMGVFTFPSFFIASAVLTNPEDFKKVYTIGNNSLAAILLFLEMGDKGVVVLACGRIGWLRFRWPFSIL